MHAPPPPADRARQNLIQRMNDQNEANLAYTECIKNHQNAVDEQNTRALEAALECLNLPQSHGTDDADDAPCPFQAARKVMLLQLEFQKMAKFYRTHFPEAASPGRTS